MPICVRTALEGSSVAMNSEGTARGGKSASSDPGAQPIPRTPSELSALKRRVRSWFAPLALFLGCCSEEGETVAPIPETVRTCEREERELRPSETTDTWGSPLEIAE